jgi:hypothetical protein
MSQMGAVEVRNVARVVVGVAAVLAQIALAFYYVGLAIFVVPPPSIVLLGCLWVAELVAAIWLAIRHTWLAPLVPVVSFIAVMLIYEYGKANLGWGA